MGEMIFRKLLPDDCAAVVDAGESWVGPDMDAVAQSRFADDYKLAQAGLIDDRVVVIGGIIPVWPGRGQVWMIADDVPLRAWPALARHCKTRLDHALQNDFKRIEAQVRVDFRAGQTWVKRLGFEPESVMRCWGPAPEHADFLGYRRLA